MTCLSCVAAVASTLKADTTKQRANTPLPQDMVCNLAFACCVVLQGEVSTVRWFFWGIPSGVGTMELAIKSAGTRPEVHLVFRGAVPCQTDTCQLHRTGENSPFSWAPNALPPTKGGRGCLGAGSLGAQPLWKEGRKSERESVCVCVRVRVSMYSLIQHTCFSVGIGAFCVFCTIPLTRG